MAVSEMRGFRSRQPYKLYLFDERKKWVRTEKVSLEKYGNRLSKQDVHMFSRRVMVWLCNAFLCYLMRFIYMLCYGLCGKNKHNATEDGDLEFYQSIPKISK